MKIQLLSCALAALLPLTSLAPTPNLEPATLQDSGWESEEEPEPTITFYEPKHTNIDELHAVCYEIFGRVIYKDDSETENMMRLSPNRMLIFDTPERTKQIITLFESIDIPVDQGEPEPEVLLHSVQYKPRHLSIRDLNQALAPFRRVVSNGLNIVELDDSGRFLLRDTPDRLAQMQNMLNRIDVAAPQVELTCYILRGAAKAQPDSGFIPKALTDNLSRLVPIEHFELASMGVLRMGAAANTGAKSIKMQGSDESFLLEMRVGAFDQSADSPSSLSLTRCSVVHTSPVPNGTINTTLFSTDTTILGSEYAVIGASGKQPTFVVLRFKPVGQ